VSSYSILVDDTDEGPYTEAELVQALLRYKEQHPHDHAYQQLEVWEMPEHGTIGHRRSVWDFIDE
jgi:hypothetical protein